MTGQFSVFVRDPERSVIELRGRDQDIGAPLTSSFDAGDQFGLPLTICRGEHALIKRNRKFVDSPLEGDSVYSREIHPLF